MGFKIGRDYLSPYFFGELPRRCPPVNRRGCVIIVIASES